jgi:hypothetical protein
VDELSKFNKLLYCTNLDGYRFWDLSIANFWDDTFDSPIDEMDSCQALLATWNPALLVVDGIQHTGESEIIRVFQEHENEMISCLGGFPIDTYGAAWLDDFGSGDLVRVTGKTAHNNLKTALADPTVLGIGHCPMLMHSMKMQSDIPCLAGLDMKQICEGDGIIAALVERGIWSLKVHNDVPDEIVRKGPRANRILFDLDASNNGSLIVDFWFPKFFFGTSVDDLLNRLNACQMPSRSSQTFVPSPSLRDANACVMSLLDNEISPTEEIVQCFLQFDSQQPPPPIPAFEVKLPVPEICGQSNPAVQAVVRHPIFGPAVWFVFKGLWWAIENNIQHIQEVRDEAMAQVQEAIAEARMEIESRLEEGESPVVVEPLPDEPEEEEEENWPLEYDPNEGYPVDGTSPCVTASQQKAAQLFTCIHGGGVPSERIGIGPVIIPHPETSEGMPMACNEVADMDWKSSHGPSVTDPEGPEYWYTGGPIIVDLTEFTGYGYTDPVPPNLVWWVWANPERFNIVPGDPLYDFKRSLEDIAYADLRSVPIVRDEFNSYMDNRRMNELLILRDTGVDAAIELTGQLESITAEGVVVNGMSLDVSEDVFDNTRFSVGDYVRVAITSSRGELTVESIILDEGR